MTKQEMIDCLSTVFSNIAKAIHEDKLGTIMIVPGSKAVPSVIAQHDGIDEAMQVQEERFMKDQAEEVLFALRHRNYEMRVSEGFGSLSDMSDDEPHGEG